MDHLYHRVHLLKTVRDSGAKNKLPMQLQLAELETLVMTVPTTRTHHQLKRPSSPYNRTSQNQKPSLKSLALLDRKTYGHVLQIMYGGKDGTRKLRKEQPKVKPRRGQPMPKLLRRLKNPPTNPPEAPEAMADPPKHPQIREHHQIPTSQSPSSANSSHHQLHAVFSVPMARSQQTSPKRPLWVAIRRHRARADCRENAALKRKRRP
jgi:hypothetical protein